MAQEFGTVQEAFRTYIEAGPQEMNREVAGIVALVDGESYTPEDLAAAMLGNEEVMPNALCEELGLPQGATYGEGATAFLGELGASSEP
jgi:hypothetical protein